MVRTQFNNDTVRHLASKGATINEIATAFNTSRETFLRIKRNDPALKIAYDEGVSQFAAQRGKRVQLIGTSKKVVTDNLDLVLRHISREPGTQFKEIRAATQLTSDEISEIMVDLILERRDVRAVRSGDGNFRYYLVREHQKSNSNATITGFNRRKPTGTSHTETQWASAR